MPESTKWEPLRSFEINGKEYHLSDLEIQQQIEIHDLTEGKRHFRRLLYLIAKEGDERCVYCDLYPGDSCFELMCFSGWILKVEGA